MFQLSYIFIISVLSVFFVSVQCNPNVQNNSDILRKYPNCKYYEDGKSIKIVDRKTLGSFKKLAVGCSNQTIDDTFFDDFPNLWYANLSNNRMNLSFLSKRRIVVNLETLILDRNFRCGSSYCHPYRSMLLAAVFPNLKRLYMRGNQIDMVSPDFSPLNQLMPRLTYLDLSDNGIHYVQALLEVIPSTLTHLILDKNNIMNFHGMPLKNLETLSLNGNDAFHLCYEKKGLGCVALKGASRLKKLSIIGRGSYFIIDEDSMMDLTNLIELNLSGHFIAKIGFNTFNNLKKLRVLELKSSVLTRLPDFSALDSLVKLDVSGNEIDISTKCIAPSRSLKVLTIKHNGLRCSNTSLATYCQDSRGVCVLSGCPTDFNTKNCRDAKNLISFSPSRS